MNGCERKDGSDCKVLEDPVHHHYQYLAMFETIGIDYCVKWKKEQILLWKDADIFSYLLEVLLIAFGTIYNGSNTYSSSDELKICSGVMFS